MAKLILQVCAGFLFLASVLCQKNGNGPPPVPGPFENSPPVIPTRPPKANNHCISDAYCAEGKICVDNKCIEAPAPY